MTHAINSNTDLLSRHCKNAYSDEKESKRRESGNAMRSDKDKKIEKKKKRKK